MTQDRPSRPQFTKAAAADVHRIAAADRDLAEMALRLAVSIREGKADGVPLTERTKTGDLSDWFKAPFGHDPTNPSHRLVYRFVDQVPEIVEVVAVGPRQDDAAYLMAGLRMERIEDPIQRSLAERIVHRVLNRFSSAPDRRPGQ